MRKTYIALEIKITDENDNEVEHFIENYVTEDAERYEDLAALLYYIQKEQWNLEKPIKNKKNEIDKAYQE